MRQLAQAAQGRQGHTQGEAQVLHAAGQVIAASLLRFCVAHADLALFRSIILFALAPGYFPEPDHRCFGRLARVAADPSNAFASSIPEQVRSVLASVAGLHPEAMASTLISSWWELNGHTSFFRHPETARVVRHTRSLAEAGGDHRGGEAAHAVRRRWRR